MTDKPTLEEIEARLAECDEGRRDVLTGGYGVRLLGICREQGEALQTAKAAMRDMLCGWRIIRAEGGEEKIYGIGWERAQNKVENALDKIG